MKQKVTIFLIVFTCLLMIAGAVSGQTTPDELKDTIDARITDIVAPKTVKASAIGETMKEVVDFAAGQGGSLQSVLNSGNVATGIGIRLDEWVNPDIISGISKYISFGSRRVWADPDSTPITFLDNNKWTINGIQPYPIYSYMSVPIVTVNSPGELKYQGITSNINITPGSSGKVKTVIMASTSGTFDTLDVDLYMGQAFHNPVGTGTFTNAYGIKLGGFNAANILNGATIYSGGISSNITGRWDIYLSQHNHKPNYLGDDITMIGLPTSVAIHATAKTQTASLASSGLIEYTSNLSGSLTSLAVTPKRYVDSTDSVQQVAVDSKIPYSDTLSRLIPTKKHLDSLISLYLLANGVTIDANGLITLPASGGINGGIKVNGTLYFQTKDTQSTSGSTVRDGLSSYYTTPSGARIIHQALGTFAPTSGNAIFSAYSSSVGINQTGGANGITSSFLAINPTAAADYRAFRAPNTSGAAFYNENSGARNIFLGETQIGSPTDAGAYQLQVTGNSYFNGTTTGISYNDLSNRVYTGTATLSGDGSATDFNIPHGLGGTPTYFGVIPTSFAASGAFYLTADATNITIHYTISPGMGTNNLTYNYSAKL
jgi:hypothetical protein